jgi:hypothetical protein
MNNQSEIASFLAMTNKRTSNNEHRTTNFESLNHQIKKSTNYPSPAAFNLPLAKSAAKSINTL